MTYQIVNPATGETEGTFSTATDDQIRAALNIWHHRCELVAHCRAGRSCHGAASRGRAACRAQGQTGRNGHS